MTFRGLLARAFFALALCVGGAALAQNLAETEGADLYQQALRLLAQERFDEAREVLQQLLSQHPEHAGAWLDMAVLQCNTGRAAEAKALLDAIESRFKPPPVLLDVINQLRAQGCKRETTTGYARLRVGRGSDSNANQGASNPNFSIGSGDSLVTLVLAPDYVPKPDQFTATSAEFSQVLLPDGTLGFAQLQARRYDNFSQFNLNSLAFGVEHPWRLEQWGLLANGSLGLTTMGGSLYQRQAQLQMQATAPLALPDGWELGIIGGWTDVAYPTLAGFDSQIWESRGLVAYRAKNAFAQASAGYALDKGEAVRPGNDRSGVVVSLLGRMRLASDMVGELGWNYQSWESQQAYSPGLIDERRSQKTSLLRASVSIPIAAQQAVNIELRAVRNRENISLFEYQEKQLQVRWEWHTQR